MRLVFIAPGNSIHTARWLRFFVERGHAVGLVSYGRLASAVDGVELLLELPRLGRGGSHAGRPLDFVRAEAAIRRALRRFAPDLLHAHYLTGPGWLGAASGVRPFVLTGWGNDVLVDTASPAIRVLHRIAVSRVAAATCESRPVADALARLGMRREDVHVILWGVDTTRFAPPEREPDDDFRVLAIRGIQPVQDPTTILEGFARFSARHAARLGLLTGPTAEPLGAALEERVRALQAAGSLEVVPPLPHEELPALFGSADVCVSIPTSDSTSVAVLEAMSCGRAVVVSDIPANRDLVEDGENGLLVPVGDVEALAAALSRLASDDGLRKRLGENARSWAVENADATVNLTRAEELYRSLVAGEQRA